MPETFASATLAVAKLVSHVVDGVATAGAATTITDSLFPYLPDGDSAPADDYYNGGTVWFLDGTHAGKTSIITDWVQSTKIMTFQTMGTTVGNTVKYSVTSREFPRHLLRQAVNEAIAKIGGVPLRYENASLVTVARQLEYSLPSGVTNLKRVEVATSSTEPYNYTRFPHWLVVGDEFIFDDGFQPMIDDRRIRLTYQAPLAALDDDADTIPNVLNLNYIKWEAAAFAWGWYQRNVRDRDPQTIRDIVDAIRNAGVMAQAHRPQIEEIERDRRPGPYSGGGTYRGEDVGRVTL